MCQTLFFFGSSSTFPDVSCTAISSIQGGWENCFACVHLSVHTSMHVHECVIGLVCVCLCVRFCRVGQNRI